MLLDGKEREKYNRMTDYYTHSQSLPNQFHTIVIVVMAVPIILYNQSLY